MSEHRKLSGKSDLLRRMLRTVQRHRDRGVREPRSVRARKLARQSDGRAGDGRQSVPRRVRERRPRCRIHGMPGPMRLVHVLQQE